MFGPDVTWLRQVHGASVVVVTAPGEHAGVEADAAVTAVPGCRLAVRTADCAPIRIVGGGGVVGLVHAGWRGVMAGVVQATVVAMRELGAGRLLTPVIGPCIHAECYEFLAADLDLVADRYGDEVRGLTSCGASALDLRAAVAEALAEVDVFQPADQNVCTACAAERYYSHRARQETERFATIVWLEP